MSITVVVPTVDRVDLLRRCLRGLTGNDVLVVHDGNREVVALLDELGVRGLEISERGVSAKRNAGWRAATTDLVAFTDDDCEPAPGWLAALVADGSDFVAGPVSPHPEDEASGLWSRTVTSTEPGFYPGCNLLLRRTWLERVDGFDEQLHGGEDTDLAWRVREAGASHGWAADALVWHAVRPVTFPEQLRSLPRWAGLPLVVRRHPALRQFAYRRWFWKDSHPTAVMALLALLLAARDRRALLGAVPVLVRRMRQAGVGAGLQLAVNDLAEVAVLTAGSARHRSVLL
ncbi:MAG: glycosyl transferase family 2 [Frankiales bacterium]|nr:glycosyl transferase family 2 [Frankiales bacterium]